VAYTAQTSFHIFTNNGSIISAFSGSREGEEVVEEALQLIDASYDWIPGATPTGKIFEINIHAYALKHAIRRDINIAETSKVALGLEAKDKKEIKPKEKEKVKEREKEKKITLDYFLVPEEHPLVNVKLTRLTSIVGRDESCDLVVESSQISRRHCLLDITARGLFVRDLDSTNGTFVNGRFIKEGYVNPRDRLTWGTYTVIVHREQSESPKAAIQKLQKLGARPG